MATLPSAQAQKISALTQIFVSKLSADCVSPVAITPPTAEGEQDDLMRRMIIPSMRGKEKYISVHYIQCYKTIEKAYAEKDKVEEAFRMARQMLLPDPNIPIYWRACFNLLLAQEDNISANINPADREHAAHAALKCLIQMMCIDGTYTDIPQTFKDLQTAFLMHVRASQNVCLRECKLKMKEFLLAHRKPRDSKMDDA